MASNNTGREPARDGASAVSPEDPGPSRSGHLVRARLSTRGYELGPRQVLPPSAYLRYLEHMRWMSRTRTTARRVGQGVVRALGIELFQEVGAHVELDLTLWISRVGRTSLDMSHEILLADDGSTVARSRATLVSLDERRRPTPFHDSVRELILDCGAIDIPPPAGSVPEGAYCRDLAVRPSDHDNQDHVNQARYADFVEDVRQICAREGGLRQRNLGRSAAPALDRVRERVPGGRTARGAYMEDARRRPRVPARPRPRRHRGPRARGDLSRPSPKRTETRHGCVENARRVPLPPAEGRDAQTRMRYTIGSGDSGGGGAWTRRSATT